MRLHYRDERCEVWEGDARDSGELIAASDLILTDPPYGLGVNRSEAYRRKHPGRKNFDQVASDDRSFEPGHLIGKPAILWGANYYADALPISPGWIGWDKVTRNGLNVRAAEFELAWTNCVRKPRLFRYMWCGSYRAKGIDRAEFVHPTQKPVALMEWCLGLVPDARIVCDPYAGSGSTAIAAIRSGRYSVSVELLPELCDLIVNRIKRHCEASKSMSGIA